MSDDIRSEPVPYKTWGEENIEPGAREQMRRAAQLPVSVQGALMPDAHVGYGLPIGGVLATHNAIIPYAVGVDIACRMKLTIFDVSPHILTEKRDKFRKAIEQNTLFGVGGEWPTPNEHPVMDDPAWESNKFLRDQKDIAWQQLGSSGSGNHFAEFGALTVAETIEGTGSEEGEGSRAFGKIPEGRYLALLSHSGSRRFGFNTANHYTQIAMDLHQNLPKTYQHLAWLRMDSEEGQAYWLAMNLAGRYASANHAVIHRRIVNALRYEVLGGVENHHNFAWHETLNDHDVYVHRKGATPASNDVYGVIPGSMMDSGFVVRGLGNADSLNSAAHGAGRQMSRKQAFKKFNWREVEEQLHKAGVDLISASLDEVPGAYKDIQSVMAYQENLVQIVATFKPLMVKMAPDEREQRRERRRRKKERDKQKKRRR
jgi:tRNA-splicing ligase RtcB